MVVLAGTLRRSHGFTLIELMVVVAVVAILSAIAYPSYRDSVLKGRRAEARSALAELLQQQERFMTQNNSYQAFVSSDSVPFKTFVGQDASGATYTLSATTCDATGGGTAPSIKECVKVVATPAFSDPQGGNLALSSTGVKTCTGSASSTNFKLCWP